MAEPTTTPVEAATPEPDRLLATKLHVPRPRCHFGAASHAFRCPKIPSGSHFGVMPADSGDGQAPVMIAGKHPTTNGVR
jgi:hypothetical protein